MSCTIMNTLPAPLIASGTRPLILLPRLLIQSLMIYECMHKTRAVTNKTHLNAFFYTRHLAVLPVLHHASHHSKLFNLIRSHKMLMRFPPRSPPPSKECLARRHCFPTAASWGRLNRVDAVATWRGKALPVTAMMGLELRQSDGDASA